MESIEGLRKKLTSNTEADIYIDSFMNEEDLEKNFTRDEFSKVIEKEFLIPFKTFL